jgi:hypothetical protein
MRAPISPLRFAQAGPGGAINEELQSAMCSLSAMSKEPAS